MAKTKKISIAIGFEELAFAQEVARQEGLSVSGYIARALREKMADARRLAEARAFIAAFAPDERATAEDIADIRSLLESPRVPRKAPKGARRRRPKASTKRAA